MTTAEQPWIDVIDDEERSRHFVWRVGYLVDVTLDHRVPLHPRRGAYPEFDMFVWRFCDDDGVQWWQETDPCIGDGSQTDDGLDMSGRPFVEALLGRRVRVGEFIDFDELVGRPLALWTAPDWFWHEDNEVWACRPLDGLIR